MDWKRLLSYISGCINEALLSHNQYLVAENRILRGQIKGRLLISDAERKTLADIGKQLGRKALEEVASIVKPDTILRWHRELIARKFDRSKNRTCSGRPRTEPEYLREDPHKKARLLKILLSNCTLKDGTPCLTYRKPFDLIAESVKTKEWLAFVDNLRTFCLEISGA